MEHSPDIIMFVVAGIGLMAYGVWGLVRAWMLRRDGVQVQGRVVGTTSDEGGGYPVIEYSERGNTHKFTSRSPLGLLSSLRVGARVPVRYSQAKPWSAILDTRRGAFGGPAGCACLGFFTATVWWVPYFSLLP